MHPYLLATLKWHSNNPAQQDTRRLKSMELLVTMPKTFACMENLEGSNCEHKIEILDGKFICTT